MEINQESVKAHKELMLNPAKYGLVFRPLEECFENSNEIKPNHLLFKDYQKECPNISKVFFYIVMQDIYGFPLRNPLNSGKHTDLGYKLKFVEIKEVENIWKR